MTESNRNSNYIVVYIGLTIKVIRNKSINNDSMRT